MTNGLFCLTSQPLKELVKYRHQLHALKVNLSTDWTVQKEPQSIVPLAPTILHLVFVLRIIFQVGGWESYTRTLGTANHKTVGATSCPGRRSRSSYRDVFLSLFLGHSHALNKKRQRWLPVRRLLLQVLKSNTQVTCGLFTAVKEGAHAKTWR